MNTWKLSKKLKETHLAPLANTFSRSSSQSTLVAEKNDDPQGIVASETMVQPPTAPVRPGILVLTLHEGKGFSLPPGAEAIFQKGHTSSISQSYGSYTPRPTQRPATAGGINAVPSVHGRYSSKYLPYALIDFDKQQVFVNSVSGTPENPVWPGQSTQYKFDVNRATELSLSLYMRNPTNASRQQDIFIGTCRVKPTYSEEKDKEAQWHDISYGTGSIKLGVTFVESQSRSLTIDDFELLSVVGRGSFGKVMQVRKRDTQRIYALKTIRKQHVIARAEVFHTLAERSVLAQISSPFIVSLRCSFQSPTKLYLVLPWISGGEVFAHLQKEQRFDINRSRFYTAELLCALECLHGFGVIYRDLKPENILIDYTGHIVLCDFGLCKLDMKDDDKTNTFCGTPEYLAPELLHGHGYTKAVDWWTLGTLLFEFLNGLPPFYDENTNEMYRKIISDPITWPSVEIIPPAARDLLTRLLDRDPTKRLGANGAAEIKAHPFFHAVDWKKLLDKKYEPQFRPRIADALDTSNFDDEFLREPPSDSYVEGPALSETAQQQFQGWSYVRPAQGIDASMVEGNAFEQK